MVPRGGIKFSSIGLKIHYFLNDEFPVYLLMYPVFRTTASAGASTLCRTRERANSWDSQHLRPKRRLRSTGGGPAARPVLRRCGGRMFVIENFEAGCQPRHRPTGASRRNQDRHLMSADATSPTRTVKRVSRWSQPGHGGARSDSCAAALGHRASFPESHRHQCSSEPKPNQRPR